MSAQASSSLLTNELPRAHLVHIRVQQRNGKKSITTVSGLDQKLNFNKLNKEFQKRWGCNGTVQEDAKVGKVIQLQGDMSENVKVFLIGEKLVTEDNIRVFSQSL